MITFADMFAGGGGTTAGALCIPDLHVSWAINHDPIAIETHAVNHPETKHYRADIRNQNVEELEPVDILWASLECTEHSKAKGGGQKNVGSFMLGWEMLRYINHLNPEIIMIENVPEFVKWGKLNNGKSDNTGYEYIRWVKAIENLGYNYNYRILNSADYGSPTRRVRYFGVFSKKHIKYEFPEPTHSENGNNLFGLKQWIPCKNYIDTSYTGESIFGREFNPRVKRKKPLSPNTLRRIAGGIKKFAPELHFIMQYYGNGDNVQSINKPLNTITTKDRHVLVSIEKQQFIADHCWNDHYNQIDEPLKPILTRQTKELITLEKKQFISQQYNSRGKPEANNYSIEKPLNAITTEEKFQFITAYFSGNKKNQNQSLNKPLNTILTGTNKKALITAIKQGLIEFDIKMRFLTVDEQAEITGFPKNYFKNNEINLNQKQIQRLIGNAVPVQIAKVLVNQAHKSLINSKEPEKIN
jgi:DNA (cytosine-5)-methyltransferase 1